MHAARAALDYEPDMMACLAECQAQAGLHGEAIMTAERTIGLSRNRATRIPECRALIVTAGSLIERFGEERRHEAVNLLEKAETLIQVSGANVLESHLRDVQEKLLIRNS